MNPKVLGFFLALSLAACGPSESQVELRQLVEESNAHCPQEITFGITLDSITYSDEYVTYFTNVTGDLLSLKTLREESDTINTLIYQAIHKDASPEIRQQLDLCAKAGAKIVFAFSNSKGDSFDITVNPADYHESNVND